MQHWLREETMNVQTALLASQGEIAVSQLCLPCNVFKDYIVLMLRCPGDIALTYHLEVRLHYLFNVSESWQIALQGIGIMGEWLQCVDLPGFAETQAQHVRGEISQVDADLVSSDDGNSGARWRVWPTKMTTWTT